MHAVQYIRCWECSTDGPFQYSMVDRNEQERLLIEKWNTRVQLMDEET